MKEVNIIDLDNEEVKESREILTSPKKKNSKKQHKRVQSNE